LSSAPKSIFSRVIPRQNVTLFFAGFICHTFVITVISPEFFATSDV